MIGRLVNLRIGFSIVNNIDNDGNDNNIVNNLLLLLLLLWMERIVINCFICFLIIYIKFIIKSDDERIYFFGDDYY